MGYGLGKISPITFDGDAFQTPSNKTHDKAPMLTPRKRRNEVRRVPVHPQAQAPQSASQSPAVQPTGQQVPLQT